LRIVWIKAGKLLPVDTGGKIRSYNLLKHLAARNEVTLLTYYDGARDEDYERQIVEQFPGAVTINTAYAVSPVRQTLRYFGNLPAAAPYAVAKFTTPQIQKLVSQWDKERRFDVAVCDFLSASLNFPATLNTPTVLFQHNVESALWKRQAAHEPNPAKRVAFKMEAAKMARYEDLAVNRFHHVIAVSEHDRKLMSLMTDGARISVVPTGVDLANYAAVAGEEQNDENAQVLFLGSMDWEANIDGVDYFCREVWPAVKASVPQAKFFVVGRNPSPRVTKWASDSVEITGRVESVLPYLRDAAVFVVPLRIGGGTRLKIYEAMAAGKAVVSTTIGAEGLDVHDGKDIFLADDEKTFAKSVIELLVNHDQRRQLGAEAARLAARYDWPIIATEFGRILAETASHKEAQEAQNGFP
jgi:sugar transferase (PEP-CTERM/EpsH1 system associated)